MMDSVLASSVDYSTEEARGEAVRCTKRPKVVGFERISVTDVAISMCATCSVGPFCLGGLFNLTWRLATQLEPGLLLEWDRETAHTYPLLMGALGGLVTSRWLPCYPSRCCHEP